MGTELNMEEFERILALSTGHMRETKPTFGNYRVLEFEYGYVIWVSYDPDDSEWVNECEEWFQPLMKYAGENNCTLILFDRDISVDEDLFPVYEW
jgi:hypothetical protein